ncbi:MAG: hypothetical protein FWE31_03790 [Firmicutes bacterium]|nr:hypothetical protein [Bacillota bacterium]
MAKKDLRKISIRGSLEELRAVIEELKSTQAFELSSFKRGKSEDVESPVLEHYTTLLARINHVLEYSKSVDDKKNSRNYSRIETLAFDQLKALGKKDGEVLRLIEAKEKLAARASGIKSSIAKHKETIQQLHAFDKFDLKWNKLAPTKSSYILYGIIPTPQLEKFREDFDLSEVNIFSQNNGDEMGVILIGHKSDQVLVDTIYDYQFRQAQFQFDTTPAGQIDALKADIEKLEKDAEQVRVASVLTSAEIKMLKEYYDYAANELDTENILAGTLKSKDYYILNGWVLDSEKKNLEILLKQIFPGIRLKWGRTVVLDEPPVFIKGNKITGPYQAITNMYGAPAKNDIDPNPFVAFFYFIFFGMMIGDIGYGIIMACLTGYVLLKIKPQNMGVKNLMLVVAMGAVSTVLWGVFFMSTFGISIGTPVIDPIGDPLMFMILAMALGVVHIMVGIALKFYNLMRQGQVVDAILDPGFRFMFFLGAVLALVGSGMVADISILFTIGAGIALTFVAGVALTAGRKRRGIAGKAIGGFGGVYSFVNYVSDILSYARLFGLGLVGAVIAMVANTMGGMFFGTWWGYIIGGIIAIAFHTFNLALALLSAYIHNARLQFIEFFSKFYEGGGSVFTPMGSTLTYVRISPKLLQGGSEWK